MCICMFVHVQTHTYICIEREREMLQQIMLNSRVCRSANIVAVSVCTRIYPYAHRHVHAMQVECSCAV